MDFAVVSHNYAQKMRKKFCYVNGILGYIRSKSSPGVGGINKLDSTLEPSGSDTSTVLRNEMDTGTLSRDRLSPLEQKVVTKGSNKYVFLS